MSVTPDDFRQTLARFASGVTVISTYTDADRPIGVTVSAFTSVSLTPPLVLICLDNATSNLHAYASAKAFGINILSVGQADVSSAFAFPGPMPPFERIKYRKGVLGMPMLDGTPASLECRVEAVYPGGDHAIIVGAVKHASWRDDLQPLIYATGQYCALTPLVPTP
ncbi:MAG: flavin reductase family protein [Rhodospirillales bacterium]